MGETITALLTALFSVAFAMLGIGLLIVVFGNPGAAVLAALLWLGLDDRDKDG
jgi:hypothetical protein